MKYNTLLALHSINDSITSLNLAINAAKKLEAHLEIRVLNMVTPVPTMVLSQNSIYDWNSDIAEFLRLADERADAVKSWIQDKEVDAVVTSSCQPSGMIEHAVSEAALYADLVLYHRAEHSLVNGIMAKALGGAIFDAGKPALIMAEKPGTTEFDFQSISIAWDPVPEAMKSLTASLPLLKRAAEVEVVIVTQNPEKDAYSADTKKIIAWLRRHGISASLQLVPQGVGSVSKALIEHINQANRDLVVMGVYGHSKFRERLFSGVSYKVLEESNTSLFIAH